MTHHAAGLRRLTGDDALARQLLVDFRQVALSAADRAMLEYALKLTLEPWQMTEADVIALREVGFHDVDILDIAQIVAYFAFVNRLADGLGVALESFWDESAGVPAS